jgi:hypothetical protein
MEESGQFRGSIAIPLLRPEVSGSPLCKFLSDSEKRVFVAVLLGTDASSAKPRFSMKTVCTACTIVAGAASTDKVTEGI